MKKCVVAVLIALLSILLSSCTAEQLDVYNQERQIKQLESELNSINGKIDSLNDESIRLSEEMESLVIESGTKLESIALLENTYLKGCVFVTHYTISETGGFIFRRQQIISGESGSGFVIGIANQRAYIMTNNHVISRDDKGNADKIYIYDYDNNQYVGNLLYSSADYDMALIEIALSSKSDLIAMEPAKENPKEGDKVYAIGAPYGQRNSIGIGEVKGYQLNDYETADSKIKYDIIIHNAYMNHGNSGGMLLDSEFKVIGINTLGSSDNDYEKSTNGSSPILKIQEFLKKAGVKWGE